MGNHHRQEVIDEHRKAKERHVLEVTQDLKPAFTAVVVTNSIAQIGKSAFRIVTNVTMIMTVAITRMSTPVKSNAQLNTLHGIIMGKETLYFLTDINSTVVARATC